MILGRGQQAAVQWSDPAFHLFLWTSCRWKRATSIHSLSSDFFTCHCSRSEESQGLDHLPSNALLSSRSVASDSVTPWTVARQSPRSMGFSRQEHWRGLPFPSPGGSSPSRDGIPVLLQSRRILDCWAARAASNTQRKRLPTPVQEIEEK